MAQFRKPKSDDSIRQLAADAGLTKGQALALQKAVCAEAQRIERRLFRDLIRAAGPDADVAALVEALLDALQEPE